MLQKCKSFLQIPLLMLSFLVSASEGIQLTQCHSVLSIKLFHLVLLVFYFCTQNSYLVTGFRTIIGLSKQD
ncbi:hypothetical protein E2C01_056582 [Portunus trituberculatus]|uniref:Uncharacterized protein n=1 Tax=Portunus trituberculatus TaxID=210409 RepID=A0A5B7GZK7_PORTR|nr:hypothetical protein [Portunus trituberculatus]